MMRKLARMDGHCRAIRAVLLEVQVGSRRIRLASSAWKDSSFCRSVEFRTHVSEPKSRHGSTQCSTMLLEERGLRAPWKTPLPLAKNARLAFLMFSSIHLVQDRLGDHSAPKHLAEVVRGNTRSPAVMCVESAGRKGEMEASHFSTFRARPWEEVYSLTNDI